MSEHADVPARDDSHYGIEARWYDALYEAQGRDIAAEVGWIDATLADLGVAPDSLLDVACGTGVHLEVFATRGLDVVGTDASPAMLAEARRRLPDVELVEADYTDFDLGRTFDVVLCMFSAIAHVGDEAQMRAAVAAMARHVAPAGAVLIEPWITRDRMAPDGVRGALSAYRGDVDAAISRVSRSWPEGDALHIEFVWTVATREAITVERRTERLPVFTRDQYLDAMRATGLTASWNTDHGWGDKRGLLVGVRPA